MANRDPFDKHGVNLSDPASHAVAVTKSDTTYLIASRALYVGGTGDVAVLTLGGETVTFVGVPTGTILPIRVLRVLAATTATNIVSLR